MSRRAFTLMELMVVTTGLVLLAALITPNVVTMKRARDARLSLIELRDLTQMAREAALRDGTTLIMRYDDSQTSMQAVRPGDPNATDENLANDQVLRSVRLADGVTIKTLHVGNDEYTAADWQLHFYSDGRAERGGFEVETAGGIDSIWTEETGEVVLGSGYLPEVQDTSWVAGEIEKRQQ